jgi:hypothetical protein
MNIIHKQVAIVLYLLMAVACDKSDPGPDSVKTEHGYAQGKVVDTQGKPLQGAEVVIENTMIYHSSLVVFTDANGIYKVRLPAVGTFSASASIKRRLNDKTYTLALHPDNPDEFNIDGSVRNFTWKLTGARGSEAQGRYGATVSINKYVMSQIYDTENIEFTLVPKGPAIDGSVGKTLVLRSGQPNTQEHGYLTDIPLGRYDITGVYKGNGQNIPIKLGNQFDSENEFRAVLQLDFEPQTMWGDNLAIIQYSE